MAPITNQVQTPIRIAEYAVVVLSVLLLLTGVIGIGQLRHGLAQLPKQSPSLPSIALRIGMVDAILLAIGSSASLLYVATSRHAAWFTAIGSWVVSVVLNCVLAVLLLNDLRIHPPGGHYAGLIGLAVFAMGVVIPGVITLITLVSVFCLRSVRRQRLTQAQTEVNHGPTSSRTYLNV